MTHNVRNFMDYDTIMVRVAFDRDVSTEILPHIQSKIVGKYHINVRQVTFLHQFHEILRTCLHLKQDPFNVYG